MKVDYISHMGDDRTVVDAARVSFDKASVMSGCAGDAKLIKYLAKNGHWTPFSHPQVTLRYTVPIFIARQEFKHIVGFTRNEISRRYVNDTPEFYVPESWRGKPEGSIKQGSGGELELQQDVKDSYEMLISSAKDYYQLLLQRGVCPEQARMILPQSMYTSYYITGSLAAFARMVKQRSDPHAQVEIQELAAMVSKIVAPLYPVSWEALTSGD